ncbi:MAG: dipeptidase [Planctomycetota bacterium]|nr:dipeptidase [Planctomycetota bacterium]
MNWPKSILATLTILSLLFTPNVFCDEPAVVVSEKARKIHASGYVWDGHNDLPWAARERNDLRFEKIDLWNEPKLHTDIPRLRTGNVGAQFWSVFVPAKTRQAGTAFQTTMEQIDCVYALVKKYPEVFEIALTASDVERIQKSGKIASLMGVEGGHSIENSLGKLKELFSRGARYMTLTHGDTLDWADAATDQSQSDGLSPFGEEVVREMNKMGMLVDLSHVSPATMSDALDITTAPVIFSHSSALAIADHPRNVPDDILLRVQKNGGLVMINFFSGFVVPESAKNLKDMFGARRAIEKEFGSDTDASKNAMQKWKALHPTIPGNIAIVVEHIDHVAKIAGVDHVGLGGDFDGVDMLPKGLEDVSRYPAITELLLRKGYSEADIHKIMSGNMMRVLKACEAAKER